MRKHKDLISIQARYFPFTPSQTKAVKMFLFMVLCLQACTLLAQDYCQNMVDYAKRIKAKASMEKDILSTQFKKQLSNAYLLCEEDSFIKDCPACLTIFRYYGKSLLLQDSVTEAFQVYNKVFTIDRNQEDSRFAYLDLAGYFKQQKNYHLTEKYLLKALHNPIASTRDKFKTILLLSNCLEETKKRDNIERAIQWYDSSLYYFTQLDSFSLSEKAQIEYRKANLYLYLNQPVKAVDQLKSFEAWILTHQDSSLTETYLFRIYNNLAIIAKKEGDYTKANQLYKQSLDFVVQHPIKNQLQLIYLISYNLANLKLLMQDTVGMFDILHTADCYILQKQSVPIVKEEQIYYSLLIKSLVCERILRYGLPDISEHNIAEYIAYAEEAVDLVQQYEYTVLTDQQRLRIQKNMQYIYELLLELHLLANSPASALYYAEYAKYGLLKHYIILHKVSKGRLDSLQFLLAYGDLPLHEEVLIYQELKAGEKANKFQINFNPSALDIGLGEDEAFLSFFYGNEKWYRFFKTNTELSVKTLPKSDSIQLLLEEWPSIISNRLPYENICRTLYRQLFQGIETIESTKNLYISGHQELLDFPFHALLTDSGDFLTEFTSIRHTKSHLLPKVNHMKYREYNAEGLIINATTFSKLSLPSLPGAVLETEWILNHVPSSSISELKDKDQLKETINHTSFPFIHIATHSKINKDHFLGSLIYLADSLYWTVKDISLLNMSTPLLVLSACETAEGKPQASEGIMGLSYAFNLAGCSNQLISKWSIHDRTTQAIIQGFYKHLMRGHTPSESLQHSHKQFLENAPNIYRHPYYWAGFIYEGDNERPNFNKERNSLYHYLLLPLILGLGILWYMRRGRAT